MNPDRPATPDDPLPVVEPIAIAPAGPPRPNLPGTVILRPNLEELIDAIAADMLFQAHGCVRAFGDFHLALSGGSTPEPLYRRLMYDPAYRGFPWVRAHLWIVDERRVPFDDPRSNFAMIRDTLVTHSGIPPEQVHPISPLSPTADTDYEREIREHLGWREKGHDRLDYVLLGMGEDGHTASLFPRSPALLDGGRLVLMNTGPAVTPPDRVTMTFRLLNSARFVAVMVAGDRKRGAVARAAGRQEAIDDLPVLGLCPLAGEQRWYLTHDACPGSPPPST